MHKTGRRFARHERGISILAVVLVMGAVMGLLSITMLINTDAEIKGLKLDQALRSSDWTIRSAVRLAEDCWRDYIGQDGPVYNGVMVWTRDDNFIDAIANGNTLYVFLPALVGGAPPAVNPPSALTYRVNLNEGIGIVRDLTNTPIWNNIEGSQRQFDARITVRPNGAPVSSMDLGCYIFPVQFQIDLQTRTVGLRGGATVDRAVTGRGSCTFYVRQRSYCEYIMFADTFETETGGEIWLPNGFVYNGPVHTNGQFRFSGNPSTRFGGIVTQAGAKAIFGQGTTFGWEYERAADHLDENGRKVYPIFEKGGLNQGFFLGVQPISLDDALEGLDLLAQGVLGGRTPPEENGVYLVTEEPDDPNEPLKLATGGIYVKGDVESITLSQGHRTQTYVIAGNVVDVGSEVSTTFSNFTKQPYVEANALRKTVITTTIQDKTTQTITCYYDSNITTLHKKTVRITTRTEEVYTRTSTSRSWSLSSKNTTSDSVNLPDTTTEYSGVVDAVVDEKDDQLPAQERRKQAAIYIDGSLGVLSKHSGSTQIQAPTGLSGEVDIDTELTICARDKVVISADIQYESRDCNAKNILGIISERDIVYLDYDWNDPEYDPDDPRHDKNIDIDAHIMAPHKKTTYGENFGVLTAEDAGRLVKSYNDPDKPSINLYGGVVQRRYGAVKTGTNDDNGYKRNFHYDPRLMNHAPPLYPKQDSYAYRFTDETNEQTLQIFWSE